jgi:hypothetical protein
LITAGFDRGSHFSKRDLTPIPQGRAKGQSDDRNGRGDTGAKLTVEG